LDIECVDPIRSQCLGATHIKGLIRRGPRAGKAKKSRGTSFANRLRRDFFRAGLVRLPPLNGKPNPAEPLYWDTPSADELSPPEGRVQSSAVQSSAYGDDGDDARQPCRSEFRRSTWAMCVSSTPVPAGARPDIDPGVAARLLTPAVSDNAYEIAVWLLATSRNHSERDTGLEPATFGLGSAGNCLQKAAAECTRPDSSENAVVDGAPECTIGADSDARGKLCGVPAVRIEEAIKALQAGDVETARQLLRAGDSASRANVTAPAADKNLPSRMPSDSSHERNT
jgi:hypothetical protein